MDPYSLLLGSVVSAVLVGAWALLAPSRERARAALRAELRQEAERAAQADLARERERLEEEAAQRARRVQELEERCRLREDALDKRTEVLEDREGVVHAKEAHLAAAQAALEVRQAEVERTLERELRELERIAELRREEAEHLLLDRTERRCRDELSQVVARVESEAQSDAERRARDALLTAMERLAFRQAPEALVATVPVADEELKAQLVGRDGRNVRSFESQTGADLLIDDTPGVVVVSCFDPVRREIARRALARLLDEGRISPPRIEVVVAETRQELEGAVEELGRSTCEAAGLDLPTRLVTLLGRLEFCSSEGQNVRLHSLEAAHLAATLAGELGLDPALARRCGLLHDLGKAVGHEADGGHAAVGADEAARAGEGPVVVNAVAAHHGEVPAASPYAVLTQLAEKISAARPGARDGQRELAIRREEGLEALVSRHPGVQRAYAIRAGREVRVVVDPAKVNDRAAARLARDLARQVEESGLTAGEVRVTVIRELRAAEDSA